MVVAVVQWNRSAELLPETLASSYVAGEKGMSELRIVINTDE